MIKYLKEYRFYIALFFFVLIPIVAIDTTSRAPRDYRLPDKVILGIVSPIQSAITWTLDKLASGFENYVFLFNVRQDNLSLLEENRKLLGTISELRESQQENLRLRKLLDFQEQSKFQTVVARVIAKDVSTEFRAIRINRGESSGIKRNMPVFTNEGIVGRVLRTSANSADVVTILDPLSAVDAIDQRSRARGTVEGLTDELCAMRFTLRTDDIQTGDVLVSSGLGGMFPKGIPLGTVSRVNRKSFGISQEVEVRPSVDFTKLEEVMVVIHHAMVPTSDKAEKLDKTDKTEKPEKKN
ncbi:rod shape-determining protein MreC [bacterium]|jgi:rod shape-determining protein MreC|nr:rod shape-determining protein MreC [bacterium]